MCTADRKEQDHWGKNNNYTVQSDKTNTSKQARLLNVCACVCRLTATCRVWSPLLVDSRFSPHEGREVACFPTVYSIWGLLPCTHACFITSSVFSATNPVATLLLMCLERLHYGHWRSSGVKSGDNAKVHVCLCACCFVDCPYRYKPAHFRGRRPGCWKLDEDTEWTFPNRSELLCGDLVDNQALSLVHQRALRPTIYKHLVELELQICYSSRGWTCYKYRAWPEISPSTFFFSL